MVVLKPQNGTPQYKTTKSLKNTGFPRILPFYTEGSRRDAMHRVSTRNPNLLDQIKLHWQYILHRYRLTCLLTRCPFWHG